MTKKIRISRKELESMSQEELVQLANQATKLEEANKNKRAEFYVKNMTSVQEKMHKSTARFVCVWAGNRCLRGDQKIWTKDGLKEIRDIQENDLVASFDQVSNLPRYNRSSAAMLKGSDRLYRVVHEKGEFVAHGQHLVLNQQKKYQRVQDLQEGDQIFQSSCIGERLDCLKFEDFFSEKSPYALRKCAQPATEKSLNLMDGYLTYRRLYGQQPNPALMGYRVSVGQQTYEALSCFLSYHAQFLLNFGKCYLRKLRHTLSDLVYKIWGFSRQELLVSEDRTLLNNVLQGLFLGPRFLLSHLHSAFHQLKLLLVKLFSFSLSTSARKSCVTSIERLEESQDYYDIQVDIDHNYIDEHGIIHHNSGKTTGGAMELRWRVLGDHPFKRVKTPIKAAVIGTDFENHIKKVIEPKIKEWFPPSVLAKCKIERNQAKAIKHMSFPNGSTIDFYSQDQADMIFEGSDLDFCWGDEPMPHHIFKSLWRGLTDRGGDFLMTGTPIVGKWALDEYKKFEAGNPDGLERLFILGKTEDNAKNLGDGDIELGKKRIKEFAAMLDPSEVEARLHGKPMELEGLVFKSFSRGTHLIKPFSWPAHWPIIESIDPHPRKPAGCSWVGLAENGAKILLLSGYLEGDTVELADEILRYRAMLDIVDGRNPRIIRSLIDNSANAPMTGKSIQNHVRERVTVRDELNYIIGPQGAGGPNIESPPKNVKGKIESLKDWLTVRDRDGRVRPDFFVFDSGDNDDFIKEIETYAWAKFTARNNKGFKDQPVKRNDDILDSVMQVSLTHKGINYNERPQPTKSVKSLWSNTRGR